MWKVTKSTLSELQELESLHFLSIYFSIPELLMLRRSESQSLESQTEGSLHIRAIPREAWVSCSHGVCC